MKKAKAVVTNKDGLHARAAARVLVIASKYKSAITVSMGANPKRVSAKSIMGLLMLAAAHGCALDFEFDGDDEDEAMEMVLAVFERELGAGDGS